MECTKCEKVETASLLYAMLREPVWFPVWDIKLIHKIYPEGSAA